MATKHTQTVLVAAVLAAFFAAGWWLGRSTCPGAGHEVSACYIEEGESVGIFDRIPPEDLAAAEQAAAAGLGPAWPAPEEARPAAQLHIADIAGVAPREEKPQDDPPSALPAPAGPEVHLTGQEVIRLPSRAAEAAPEDTHATMIVAPVRFMLIKNTEEYKAFKQRARGSYPAVDFDKQMLIALESDSNLPDAMFEIVSAAETDGQLLVEYRVNVLGLDKKVNSHSVLAVDKTPAAVELKQVL